MNGSNMAERGSKKTGAEAIMGGGGLLLMPYPLDLFSYLFFLSSIPGQQMESQSFSERLFQSSRSLRLVKILSIGPKFVWMTMEVVPVR